MKSNFIYVDPPWKFKVRSTKGMGRSAENHYPCMSLKDIKALDVGAIAAKDAYLAMWVTTPMLLKASEVASAWGFKHYSGTLFVWIKNTKEAARLNTFKPAMGLGYTTRKNAELCLLFKKGRGVARINKGISEILLSPRRKHSEKPKEAIARIEKLFGNNLVNPVELFARSRRVGWLLWGNEIINDFELGTR
jgi:N6-adenosine-specific RNA methylase IME4